MKEKIFIKKAKEHIKLEEFVRKQFADAKCGDIEVQNTPVVTRIIIHTTTSGLIIGSGGERIRETVDILKKDFGIENPQIDVQRIEIPELDSNIVAQAIASALEDGVNFRKLGNYYTQRIMEAGAVGCEIVMSGKISGQRGRTERFISGYLKKCGEPAERDVNKGVARALPKLGCIGVTVKIMLVHPETLRFNKNAVVKAEPKKEVKKEVKTETETIDTKENDNPKENVDNGNIENEESP
ncbi:30S ribosomal protein S3 [archaeon]|nr:30S ribosomal protein S3 [archaeon]